MANMLKGLIVGLDLDGVCADYIAAMRQVTADSLGVASADLPEKRSWGFEDWGIAHEQWKVLHREAVNERRVFRDADMITGADTAVRCLHDAGAVVRVITNRLCDDSDPVKVFADTSQWLNTRGIPYDELCFVADKSTVAADVYVDDSPSVLEALAAAGRTAVVFDWPYNRTAPGIRARGWAEALPLIFEIGGRVRAAA